MVSMSPIQRIAENVARVREAIARAAGRSGRSAEEVRLVAVTKYVGLVEAEALLAAGCCDLGESRPQELWRKAEQLAGQSVRWHMIGHLQRNKAPRTLPLIDLLHSGDSLRLLQAANDAAALTGRVTDVLLEANVSGDQTKHGFLPEQVAAALDRAADWPHLRICGLMAMAGWGTTPEEARRDFIRLRQLRDRLQAGTPPGVVLEHLSMGMSGDFEVAIEEGATLVRVGSALFEGIDA
jgi:PLP dependent protein